MVVKNSNITNAYKVQLINVENYLFAYVTLFKEINFNCLFITILPNKPKYPLLYLIYFSTNCITDKICLDLPSTFTNSLRMRALPRQAVLCVSMATLVTCYFEAEASRGLERPAL